VRGWSRRGAPWPILAFYSATPAVRSGECRRIARFLEMAGATGARRIIAGTLVGPAQCRGAALRIGMMRALHPVWADARSFDFLRWRGYYGASPGARRIACFRDQLWRRRHDHGSQWALSPWRSCASGLGLRTGSCRRRRVCEGAAARFSLIVDSTPCRGFSGATEAASICRP